MKKFLKYFTTVCLAFILTFGAMLTGCGGGGKDPEKDEYTVTYNLNYDGAPDARVVTVKANTRTSNWRATRKGYTLEGWYTEKSTQNKYDFMEYVNSDLQLWAKWNKDAEKRSVSFDFNYEGGGEPAVVSVDEGSLISESLIPACPRLGMEFEGWYRDVACSADQKWNFATDTVGDSALTLYAKYQVNSSIDRNDDGSIKYDNVQVTVWTAVDFGFKSKLDILARKFNQQHKGEITINLTSGTLTNAMQSSTAIRIQQNPNILATYSTYYSAIDVMDFAGVTHTDTDYYEGAVRDAYVNGKLYSLTFLTGVPYLVYNKALMTKYNTEQTMPASYSEFKELLLKVYAGESVTNPSFNTILTSPEWTFKEGTLMSAFMQNGADYTTLENGNVINKWGKEDNDPTFLKAVTAFKNTYNLFGASSELHGALTVAEYGDGTTLSRVGDGTAFMGIVNFPAASSSVASSSTLGYMPIAGLFSDDEATRNLISADNIGFQFYKAADVSLTQLAAGALFADYVRQNSADFADNGWMPSYRPALASDTYQNLTSAVSKLVKAVCPHPENLRTFDGCQSLKEVFNKIAAEGVVVPVLSYPSVSDEDFLLYAESLRDQIQSQLGMV